MILNGTTLALAIMGIALLGLIIQNYIFARRLRRFMRGRTAESLEETISGVITDMQTITETFDEHRARLTLLDQKAARAIQGVSTLRFNPFKNAGGNHSFATAFSNEHGDGVIISTLYGRERVSMFAKPIKNWKSEFELTTEEQTALEESREYHSK